MIASFAVVEFVRISPALIHETLTRSATPSFV